GLLFHVFDHYGPRSEGIIGKRPNGVLISNGTGTAPAYALYNLQDRGRMLIDANVEIYEGQLVGIHAKDNDLTVNALRAKQLTNVRASGKDDALNLVPPVRMSDRKSTRLNSSHVSISYAVFCLKKNNRK